MDKRFNVRERVQREVRYADMTKIQNILKSRYDIGSSMNVDIKKVIREAGIKIE